MTTEAAAPARHRVVSSNTTTKISNTANTNTNTFTPAQVETFFAVADAVIPSITGDEALADFTYDLHNHLPEKPREYWDNVLTFAMESASQSEEFHAVLGKLERRLSKAHFDDMTGLLDMLRTKAGSLILCGTLTPFHLLPVKERQKVLLSWKTSNIGIFQKAYKGLVPLICSFYALTRTAHRGIGFPSVDEEIHCPERFGKKKFHKFKFANLAEAPGGEVTVDVVIVGSGSGGGVVAKNIGEWAQRNGKKMSILVLEKGKYIPHEDLTMTEFEAAETLYENALMLPSEDGSVTFVAGSTFGGGSAVNWSASLATPGLVRREWAEEYGLDWFMTRQFQQSIDRVQRRMGVSTKHLEHNIPNKLLIEGATRLGYGIQDVPQNTGGAKHPCGYCGNGCRFGEKQGGPNCWLVDASKAGVRFAQEVYVEKVLFEDVEAGGKTWISGGNKKKVVKGVLCYVGNERAKGGRKQVRINAKKVIISSGSLHSPALLLRSGLTRNPSIGANLRIHPTSFLYGYFPPSTHPPTNPYKGPILSTVITETATLSPPPYTHYGSRIETPSMQPGIGMCQLPWNGGAEWKKLMAMYTQCVAVFSIARDGRRPPPTSKSTAGGIILPSGPTPVAPEPECGKVSIDKLTGDPVIGYTITHEDRESIVQGLAVAAQVLVEAGATMLVPNLRTGEIYRATDEIPASSPEAEDSLVTGTNTGATSSSFQHWLTRFTHLASQPSQLTLGTAHQIGTCRMSSHPWSTTSEDGQTPTAAFTNPKDWVGYLVTNAAGGVSSSCPGSPGLGGSPAGRAKPGVVDQEGRVYGVDGLWVMDASVLPGSTGVNPMVTVMAAADALSRRLCGRWEREGYVGGEGKGAFEGMERDGGRDVVIKPRI